jgi:hypothetical protein
MFQDVLPPDKMHPHPTVHSTSFPHLHASSTYLTRMDTRQKCGPNRIVHIRVLIPSSPSFLSLILHAILNFLINNYVPINTPSNACKPLRNLLPLLGPI